MRPFLRPATLLAPIPCACPPRPARLPPSRAYAAAPKPAPPPADRLLTAARKVLAAAEAADADGSGTIEAAKRMRELEPLRRALRDLGEGEEVSWGRPGREGRRGGWVGKAVGEGCGGLSVDGRARV